MNLPKFFDGGKKTALAEKIQENYLRIREWAIQSKTDCFRLYDRELPAYPLAIDYYAGRFCLHYFSPSRRDEEPPGHVVEGTVEALSILFQISPTAIYWRTRAKQKATRQYEKEGESKEFFVANEYGVKFKINLVDYLDTGLFLDHRQTRQIVSQAVKGKRLLNLFAYTCSFSVQAAVAGAAFTKSVDMSNTYVAWGRENFLLNSISAKNHPIVRADCLRFLDDEIKSGIKYDVIVIDPPTISRSKKMEKMFDVQEDYIALIAKAQKLLIKEGVIFFSTNARKFSFDTDKFLGSSIIEISEDTIPLDFCDKKIHRCWSVSQLAPSRADGSRSRVGRPCPGGTCCSAPAQLGVSAARLSSIGVLAHTNGSRGRFCGLWRSGVLGP